MKTRFRFGCAVILSAVLLLLLCSCVTQTAPPRTAAQANGVDWNSSLYYGNFGKISFLYEPGVDEVSPQQDTNEVLQGEDDDPNDGIVPTAIHQIDTVSVSCSEKYSIGITYQQGTADLDEKQEMLSQSQSASGSLKPVGESDEEEFAGYEKVRRMRLQAEDGSGGSVYYGNTESGYFEIYYILAANATADEASHMQDILSSIRFGQYTENDLVFDDNSTHYVKIDA